MAVLIFVVWAAPEELVRALGDIVEFIDENDGAAGQLIVTLGALAAAVMGLLVIVVELAPEDEPKELRVEQAGATTVIPADALRLRLEEALLALPDVTAARARVHAKDKGIASVLELTVTPSTNVAEVTQSAARVVVDVVQTDLGLPIAGVPVVKVAFGGSKPAGAPQSAAPVVPPPLEPSPSVMAPIEPANPGGFGSPAPPTVWPPADAELSSAPPDTVPEPSNPDEAPPGTPST
jgi:hypothetical protein